LSKYESEAVRRAKAILASATSATSEYSPSEKPSGCVCLADIAQAERNLYLAQQDLAEYQRSDAHMHETLSADGRKGLAVGSLRGEVLEQKQDLVAKRRRELAGTIRAWIAGTEE
jgi:hypothetical protein